MVNASASRRSFFTARLTPALAATVAFVSLSASLAVAGQRSDGRLFFDHAPRLVRTATSAIPTTYMGGATYEFTITVPKDAGAPLQAVTIVPEPGLGTVEFNPSQSRAIAANGANLPLASIGDARGTEAPIAFEQPIQPGETVTVALKTERSPSSDGVYLYGVTAYPVGDQSNGLFLGYGRVQIYGHGG